MDKALALAQIHLLYKVDEVRASQPRTMDILSLCTVRCVAASLAPPQNMPIAPSNCDNQKGLQTRLSVPLWAG